MDVTIKKLVNRIRIFSGLMTLGGGVFLLGLIFPEYLLRELQLEVSMMAVLFIVIGWFGLTFFSNCPRCGNKVVMTCIRKSHSFDVRSWISAAIHCDSCANTNQQQ